jgi:hypothetical protein
MPEKKSEYSLLVYSLMIVVFLALAFLGSCIILNITAGSPASGDYYGSGGYLSEFFINGRSHENQSGLQYAHNGSFSGTWHYSASNDWPGNDSCLILALVDYNLTPLYYNGSLAGSHTTRFSLPVSFNVSFNLTGLQEGFHDVLFLTAPNPYAIPLSFPGVDIPGWVDGNSMLFNVIEGNDTRPDVQYGRGPLDKYVSYRNVSGNNPRGYGPWLTEKPFIDYMTADGGNPSGNDIRHMDVSPGEDIDYYINIKSGVGSGSAQCDQFALVQLLDYEQIPIRRDTPENVYYGAMGEGRFFAIHAGIKAPETPGTHVLSLAMTTNPYREDDAGSARWDYGHVVSVVLNVKE